MNTPGTYGIQVKSAEIKTSENYNSPVQMESGTLTLVEKSVPVNPNPPVAAVCRRALDIFRRNWADS